MATIYTDDLEVENLLIEPAVGEDPSRLFGTLTFLGTAFVVDAIQVHRRENLQVPVDPENAQELDH